MRFHFIAALILFTSCESETSKTISTLQRARMVDSLKESYVDKANKEMELEAKEGEVGSPVKINYCKISNGNEINISYQNISDKEIDAVKIAIFAYDNFEEYREVNMGFPFITGMSQKNVKPGKTVKESLDAYSFKGVTKLKSYVVKVHYKDGGNWDNKKWLK